MAGTPAVRASLSVSYFSVGQNNSSPSRLTRVSLNPSSYFRLQDWCAALSGWHVYLALVFLVLNKHRMWPLNILLMERQGEGNINMEADWSYSQLFHRMSRRWQAPSRVAWMWTLPVSVRVVFAKFNLIPAFVTCVNLPNVKTKKITAISFVFKWWPQKGSQGLGVIIHTIQLSAPLKWNLKSPQRSNKTINPHRWPCSALCVLVTDVPNSLKPLGTAAPASSLPLEDNVQVAGAAEEKRADSVGSEAMCLHPASAEAFARRGSALMKAGVQIGKKRCRVMGRGTCRQSPGHMCSQ